MEKEEKNCYWHFAESKGGIEQGPKDAMSETFKKVPYDALVRESIQNSIDAVDNPNAPVVMEFNFGKINYEDFPKFYDLKYHILGCIQKFNTDDSRKKFMPMSKFFSESERGMNYLAVSDSNTVGMDYNEQNPESTSFYSFVKCAGNSIKSNSDSGGSFGFGKAAYFNISRIRALLVSTQTKSGNCFFEGVASLCTHKYNNEGNYMPVGFYCDNDEETPIHDINSIPGLFRRDKPGTTAFIMGIDLLETPKKEIVKEIAKSVVFNFWCAILHKKLVVKIDNCSIVIDSSNIEKIAAEYFIEFDEEPGHSDTRNPRPYIEAVANAKNDDKHICLPLYLNHLGECYLYVLKRKAGTDNVVYMRTPKMLVFNKKNNSHLGFYAVFICDNKKGNELLKSVEDPSHREWNYQRLDDKSAQQDAHRALIEMNRVIREKLRDLFASENVDKIDIRGLEDYLYIPTEYDEDNDDSDVTSDTGVPTGHLLEDSTSMTTEINDLPKIDSNGKDISNTGTIILKKSQTAIPDPSGNLKSGHGTKPRKGTKPGVPMPGNRTDGNVPNDDGTKGIFATDIEVPYRSFSQVESGQIVHYVILRSPSDVEMIQISFYSVGEDGSEDKLQIVQTDHGSFEGNLLKNLSLSAGSNKIRVRFDDNMKHSLQLKTQELIKA